MTLDKNEPVRAPDRPHAASLRIASYAIAALAVFSVSNAWAQTPLSCGQVISASIALAAEQDVYVFSAEAGDTVLITLAETGDIDAFFTAIGTLYSPTGAVTVNQLNANATARVGPLSESGSYTLILRDSASLRRGNYAIGLEWLLPASKRCDTTALSCGNTSSSSRNLRCPCARQ